MVYPKLVLELMPVGLLGVMMAALVAALTSTLSAILNSVSTLFTMDFYSVLKEGEVSSDEQVRVGRITSVVVLVIAVFWAPQIGGFDSLVKYYQQMLSYIAPPIVAAFFLGLFSKRANATGTISGLITGLVVAVLLLFYKESIFGDMHFLLVVPYLFGFSLLVMIGVSWLTNEPPKEKIEEYTWSQEIFIKETKQMKGMKWYRNYRFWSLALLVFCFVVLWLYR
jgi:SSS family solute:Na+ symporter